MRLIKEYCCCAIPLLNAGIYITLTEQFVVAVTVAILSLVTPPIVGASVPSFVHDVLAILCFLVAAVQGIGFMGVSRESTIIFRRYTTLHLLLTTIIFSYCAVFIGISASKHNTAVANCKTNFFPFDPTATATSLTGSATEGQLLCNIFTWVGVGTMGGLWLILALFHTYLFFVISGYGSSQRDDHSKYYSLYSLNSFPGSNAEHLPPNHIGMRDMANGGDAWDTRNSMDTVGFEKPQLYNQQSYSNGPTTYQPPHRQGSVGTMYPAAARTMSPAPTPSFHTAPKDPYYSDVNMGMERPAPSVTHPAEGSFHRKTPRMTPAPQEQVYSDSNFDRSFFAPP